MSSPETSPIPTKRVSTRQRRRARARRSLAMVAVAAACVGFGLIAVRPEMWLVEQITFDGHHHATAGELRHLANLPNGTPIWAVYPPAVERSVEAHPWVRDARVEVAWPSAVHIRVEEHEPAALLWDDGRLVYIDRQGAPFLPATPDDLDYPHLTGFPTGDAHPDLKRAAVRGALALIDQLDARGRVRREDVSEVAFRASSGFTVFAGPARILLAPERFEQQLDRLDRLAAGGVDLSAPVEIDLAPTRVAIVRDLNPPRPLPPKSLPPIPPSPALESTVPDGG